MGKYTVLVVIILMSNTYVLGQKPLGGVFDEGNLILEAAFRVAAAAVSENQEEASQIVARPLQAAPGDVTDAGIKACEVLQSGAGGIVGPTNKESIQFVQSICDSMDVPHLIVDTIEAQNRNWSVVNMYPSFMSLSKAVADLITAKGWETFTVIFEGSEHLTFMDEVFTLHDIETDFEVVMSVVQLPEDDDYRPYLTVIKKSGSVNYLVHCSAAKLQLLLEQAQQVGIMSDEHNYIIFSLDMQTLDLTPFQYGGANITGFRLFNPEDENVINFVALLETQVTELSEGNFEGSISAETLPLKAALIFDAVTVYANALAKIDPTFTHSTANCETGASIEHGYTIINLIRTSEVDGLTGSIKFNSDGFRADFDLDVMELTPSGFIRVGTWGLEDGFTEMRQPVADIEVEGSVSMKGKHFLILTALSAPYGMRKESPKKLEGNEQFEGFGIELIQELAKIHQFNYTFELQIDGAYGSLDKSTGKWNGMMEKIMDGRADFAITDLTITADRQKAVDFTSPFMNLGISILYKKPAKQPPDLFSFISPFSTEVWGWLAGAFVGVSVLLFIVGRICPDEWQNPYPCIEEPETLDNQFTLANAFWFTLGSVLTQGSEIAPIAIATRIGGSVWWFFTLIMVSSYTANLAAFLTVESKFSPIDNANDLANNQYDIKYGAKAGGSTLSFFKESDNAVYQKMYEYMNSHPEYLTASNDEGLARVKSTEYEYAYLMESTSIEYIVERNCDVAQVGGLIDNKGYGIAMIQGSPYRQPMSEAVLQLQEEGMITKMKNKWWKEKRGGGACADDDGGSGQALPLELANVGGVFIVLAAGSGLAVLCAFFEMLLDVWATSIREKVSFKEELFEELKFIFKFSGLTKPVRHQESEHSGSGGTNKSGKGTEADSGEKEAEGSNRDSPSERSVHSRHTAHSQRSHSVKIAKMRKYSHISARS